MHRNLRRLFGKKSTRLRSGGYRSPSALAAEFAAWLEKNTDATHIEINSTFDGYEVTWLEPVKKVR